MATALIAYLDTLTSYPPLPDERKGELVRRIGTDRSVRDELACSYLRFVVKLAETYLGKYNEGAVQEGIAEGNLALLRALQKYDPDTISPEIGQQVGHYALTNYIRTTVTNAIRSHVLRRIRQSAWHVSLNDPLFADEEVSYKDWLADPAAEDPEAMALGDTQRTKLYMILEDALKERKITEKGAIIIGLYHQLPEGFDPLDNFRTEKGISPDRPLSFQKIGGYMNLSRERPRQIYRRALARLHDFLNEQKDAAEQRSVVYLKERRKKQEPPGPKQPRRPKPSPLAENTLPPETEPPERYRSVIWVG